MVPLKLILVVESPKPVLIEVVGDCKVTLLAKSTDPPIVVMALPLRNILPVVPDLK